MVYQWQEKKGTSIFKSVWTLGARKSMRKEARQFVVRSTRNLGKGQQKGGKNFTLKGVVKRN